MSHSLQDSVIDDDEETCPLCIEEFDLSDKNFKPCPCGYQICQFCFHSLKNKYENSTCPNCRRPYDEKTIQYKIPSAEEFKLDQQNKNRKQAAAKRKETEKREVETSSRRNLAGVRVKQMNLVYVIGLIPTIKDETFLLQTLRGQEYFGQYGEIEKIVVSKAKSTAANQGIGVYVTYAKKEDAALCIQTVDGSSNGERILRAQYGTTKYCSAFLRHETCNNKNCSFLHETGEDGQGTSPQGELNSKATTKTSLPLQPISMPPPPRPAQITTSSQVLSQPMARQSSGEESNSRKGSTDATALPSSASWASAPAQATKTRRTSQAASRATPSPQIQAAIPNPQTEDANLKENDAKTSVQQTPALLAPADVTVASAKMSKTPDDPFAENYRILDKLIQNVSRPEFRFVFNENMFTREELEEMDRYHWIDPYGGAKWRLVQDKEEARQKIRRAELEAARQNRAEAAQSPMDDSADEENIGSGSLALGGEPEDNPRSASARGAIGRPLQTQSSNNFIPDQFSALSLNGRTLTPQERQSAHGSGSIPRAPGLGQAPNQTGSEFFDFDRSSQFAHQQHDPMQGHQRQNSRYFPNDAKSAGAGRFQNQQPSLYQSSVQGPPPGLPTAGTPPFSGGGMFAHGQGFTSNVNSGFGAIKDGNTEAHHRGRSTTNDKRELLLSLQNPLRSPPLSAPAPGLLNPLYGQYAGAYQDPGLVKQKKKGKKHRHANTSSSGGGAADLVDPSILQARLHQAGTGQGLFGGNQVDEKEFPSLPSSAIEKVRPFHSRVSSFQSLLSSTGRTGTPKIPPGFEITHGHPSPTTAERPSTPLVNQKTSGVTPVIPAIPILPIGQHSSNPKPKTKEVVTESSTEEKAEKNHADAADAKTQPQVGMSNRSPFPSSEGLGATNEISLSSPAPKGAKTKTEQKNEPPKPVEAPKSEEEEEEEEGGEEKVQLHNEPTPTKVAALRAPGKIDIPSPAFAPTIEDDVKSKTVTPVLGSAIVATPQSTGSRPQTPATGTSEISKSSAKRPLTIRVTTNTTRPAESVPASAVTEQSMVLPSAADAKLLSNAKLLSRTDSVGSPSLSRPSTPAMSDRFSADYSRASSPPPSIVGSAPERTKTKAQQKKERKDKAKKATETSEGPNTAATTPVTEQVAPVIGRQRKQKKAKSEPSKPKPSTAKDSIRSEILEDNDDAHDVSDEASTVKARSDTIVKPARSNSIETRKAKSVKASTARERADQLSTEPSKPPYTLRDLFNETMQRMRDQPTTAESTIIQKVLNEHIPTVTTILDSLFKSKELDPKSALFNHAPFNSSAFKLPQDSRRGQDYLSANGYTDSNPFGTIYLGTKEKHALLRGQDVSVSDENRPDDLLRRALVTGWGTVYRHLCAEEEEKVVGLEERREEWHAEFGETLGIGLMDKLNRLEESDYNNIEGDVGDLVRFGDRFGVGWVRGQDDDEEDLADEFGEDEEADDEEEDDDDTDDLGIDLDPAWSAASAFGVAGAAAATTAQKVSSATRGQAPVNLRLMTPEQLSKRIGETAKEMEVAKKESERIEKLLKNKNREVGRFRDGIPALRA